MTATPSPQSRSTALGDVWYQNVRQYADRLALWAPHLEPPVKLTYRQMCEQICCFASGLQAVGVKVGDRVALIADNSPRWLIADRGSLMAGTVNVPRSSSAPETELDYILEHSGSSVAILEDRATLERLHPSLKRLGIRTTILLSDQTHPSCLSYPDLMARGASREFDPPALERSQLATIIYTSGTTGRPKGVMLSHGNFMHQVEAIGLAVQPQPGERFLSILPTWHSYERSGEYFLLSRGCELVYTTRRSIKQDLKTYAPHYMVAVPRIWETVYEGVQRQFREKSPLLQKVIFFCLGASERWVRLGRALHNRSLDRDPLTPLQALAARLQRALLTPIHALGNLLVYQKVRQAVGPNFRFAISGGGALADHLETFYEIVGIDILVGYGLTETSPVLTVRPLEHNVRGTSGLPLKETEVQICDPDTLVPLPRASTLSAAKQRKGIVRARGPQIMLGYYRNPEATAKVLDAEGWFNTGDLGWLAPDGQIVLTGRAKDTIVLTSGENIEPQPLENACARSPWVDQIVVVGQDQKRLAALVYPNLLQVAQSFGTAIAPQLRQLTQSDDPAHWLERPEAIELLTSQPAVRAAVLSDLQQRLKQRPGYRPDEQLGDFRFVPEPFSIENGLMTQTYKIRRNRVVERYAREISELYG
ncbi:long-chain fatty acid--CoA ligase [Synechococcus sp. PCC 7336]|uniref:AMP-dependent synthetase/ligase n=1 Tax=Synechococcus sp. PCC 7336 TaxID=195250 RepID=UPI00034C568F|nr:AMP-binding protein [Synechococcus sp. PCC 7336]